MKKIKYKTHYKKIPADHLTPVLLYQRIREEFPCSSLLESFDQNNHIHHYSYIGFDRLGYCKHENNRIITRVGKEINTREILPNEMVDVLNEFTSSIQFDTFDFPFSTGGFLGYLSYDSALLKENIPFHSEENIPYFQYQFYRFFLVFDHFRDEVYLFENSLEEKSKMDEVIHFLQNGKLNDVPFSILEEEIADMSDENFLQLAEQGIKHCARGDVFQLVISRCFYQKYEGDDFKVYRELRRINPSPYLFYFDFGNFNLFGSSPEAQLILKNNIARVNPIAGTYKKTGKKDFDEIQKNKLINDEKEIAEHIMLVDLARNDLNKTGMGAKVTRFRELEEYSHVFHLVSEVECKMKPETSIFETVFNTYPAGTLTGAPKHKAMQLIQQYEKSNRTFYGGCIGMIDSNKQFNHAIAIRSFLSKNNCLTYRAGAGITIQSKIDNEKEEIDHKLNALRTAIKNANKNLL